MHRTTNTRSAASSTSDDASASKCRSAELMSSIRDVLKDEQRPLLELAIPTMILQLGLIFTPLVTASCVGRKLGAVFLSSLTLANLTGNLCALSLLVGLYSASDTLSPQAFGAGNHREVGLLAMRGFFSSLVILAIVNAILIPNFQPILLRLGQDPEAANYASQWYNVYAIGLPFYSLYTAAWKFLSAQNVMTPLLYSCVISCVVVLPVSLELFMAWYGFVGSAYAYVAFQISQVSVLFVILAWKQPYEAATWPGLRCWREALDYQQMMKYVSLGVGGMLAQCSWVYWEALGLMVGTLGVLPLSIHTIPTQLIMATSLCQYGIAVALSNRMGVSIPKDVRRTKLLAAGVTVLSMIFCMVVSVLLYVFRTDLIAIFTTDQHVIDGARRIWLKVCIYNFAVCIFSSIVGVVNGLGMQWELGMVNAVFLWLFGIPITYYTAIVQGHGVGAVWTWIIMPYAGIDIVLTVVTMRKDWDAISRGIQQREGMKCSPAADVYESNDSGTLPDSMCDSSSDDGSGIDIDHIDGDVAGVNERTYLLIV